MQRVSSLEKTLMMGKTEDKRRRGQQRMRRLDNITDSMDMNSSKLRDIAETEEPDVLQSMCLKRVGHDLATEQQQQKYRCTFIYPTRTLSKGYF